MKISEEQFIEQINLKKIQAYRILYREYYRTLVSFALNYLDNQEEAEDVVQELFIVVWEGDRVFDTFGKFRTFLYTSIRNTCLNQLKHNDVAKKYMEFALQTEEDEEESNRKIIAEEAYRILFATVETFPKRCKEIFELHMQGKKNEEIADLLGLSVLTVKTQKNRGMKILRMQMGDLFFVLLALHILE